MPLNSRDLQKRVEEIFDFAYTNSNIRIPAKTCKEVGKLLHVGMYREEVEKQVPAYSFNPSDLASLDGNNNSTVDIISANIHSTFADMNRSWKLYDDDGIEFDGKCIGYIVGKLSDLYISDPSRDVFGDALEIFRSRWAKQEGGQFFTDQRVTSLAVRLARYDPLGGDDLVDICAGTGGFLLAGFNKIKEDVDANGGTEKEVIQVASKSLKGQEIDSEVAALGNSTLLARTGRYADAFIHNDNSLDAKSYSKDKKLEFDSHDCAVTNPPFGAKISIKDTQVLKSFELAKLTNRNVSQDSYSSTKLYRRAPDILFVEQNVRLLKPGTGRLAIVVPYQIISGPQTLFVRDWLVRNAEILAVVDLPGETFQPHTGTKTALLVLRRRSTPLLKARDAAGEKIFMSVPRWIGHDRRGNPVYRKEPDGSESAEILSDFGEVELAHKHFLEGGDPEKAHGSSFVTPIENVIGDDLLRLNALYHRGVKTAPGHTVKQSKEWDFVPISSVVERIFYPGRFTRNYVDYYDGAIPFLGGSNINQLVRSTDKWLSHTDPRLDQLSIQQGWLLVTRSGTTGIISSVPEAWDGFAMSEHVIRIVPDKSKLASEYLLAFLKTEHCQNAIAKNVFGSVIDEITPDSIGEILIPIPKDRKKYDDLCKQVAKAEKAKQAALVNLYDAVDKLSGFLPN